MFSVTAYYVNNSLRYTKCNNAIKINLIFSEIQLVKNYKKQFNEWGFDYVIYNGYIEIKCIPLIIESKDDSHKVYYIIFYLEYEVGISFVVFLESPKKFFRD